MELLATIDRAAVREFVAGECRTMREIANAGGNVHQYQLDRQDTIATFTATLHPEDAINFWTLYSEEMDAASAAIMESTAAMNAQTANIAMQNAAQAGQVGTWIALIMFFAGVAMMIHFLRQ